MCGICGVVSDYLTEADIRSFQELMHLNVWRGWEGAGCAILPEDVEEPVRILRTTSTGTSLILSKEFKEAATTADKKRIQGIIGHTRYPTKGENKIENVHPFEFDHIIGVHNGTFRKINDQWLHGSDQSDTKLAYEEISKKGLKDTIKDVEGAYCLVWYDTKEQTINFLRNHERPLHFCRTGGALFWSSEYADLNRVLSRRMSQKLDITYLPVNRWFTIPYPFTSPFSFKDDGEVRPMTFFERHPDNPFYGSFQENNDFDFGGTTNRGRNYNHANAARFNGSAVVGINRRGVNSSLSRHFPTSRFPAPVVNAESEREHHPCPTAPGWYVERERLLTYLKNGCAYCGDKADIGEYDRKEIKWIKYNEFICSTCKNSPAIVAELAETYPVLQTRSVQ